MYKEQDFNIISFSGRKESGKTELANLCANKGYEKKSFATALKKLVCETVGFESIEELNTYKNKPLGKTISTKELDIIERITGFDRESIKNTTSKITEISTARDWLQIIGTDCIRSIDPDWHVNRTIETLEEGKKYVFDDTRFKNELKRLKEIGAECWFIIRNKTDNISNHPSETQLTYRDFDYNVIFNNKSLEELKKNWTFYMEFHRVENAMRRWSISQLFINNHLHLPEDVLEKMFVYPGFRHINDNINIPKFIVEKEDHTGFIGDHDDPFVIEMWKMHYRKEA